MWKRATTAVLLLAMGGTLLAIGAGPASAQPRPSTGEGVTSAPVTDIRALAAPFRIRNLKSKMYLQNPPNRLGNGIEVVQHPFNTTGYQEWVYVADGQYDSLMHNLGRLNMGINWGSPTPGAHAILAYPDGGYNQDWLVVVRSVGVVELHNRGSGLCLGISNASTVAGARAAQFACDGALNQGWEILPL